MGQYAAALKGRIFKSAGGSDWFKTSNPTRIGIAPLHGHKNTVPRTKPYCSERIGFASRYIGQNFQNFCWTLLRVIKSPSLTHTWPPTYLLSQLPTIAFSRLFHCSDVVLPELSRKEFRRCPHVSWLWNGKTNMMVSSPSCLKSY